MLQGEPDAADRPLIEQASHQGSAVRYAPRRIEARQRVPTGGEPDGRLPAAAGRFMALLVALFEAPAPAPSKAADVTMNWRRDFDMAFPLAATLLVI